VVDAASDALQPLFASPALLPAVAWGLFAAVLPWLIRGRWRRLDIAAGVLWAIGLILALDAFADVLAGATALDGARGAIAGSVLGAAVAVTVARLVAPVAASERDPALL
jgi:ribose/xylose/arabinose/galactoside ABC-type transport system permease subunit